MEGRHEGLEPLDRAHDLSSMSGEVETVGRGDRSMQQCRWETPEGDKRSVTELEADEVGASLLGDPAGGTG
jgi:hypothetical protein